MLCTRFQSYNRISPYHFLGITQEIRLHSPDHFLPGGAHGLSMRLCYTVHAFSHRNLGTESTSRTVEVTYMKSIIMHSWSAAFQLQSLHASYIAHGVHHGRTPAFILLPTCTAMVSSTGSESSRPMKYFQKHVRLSMTSCGN